MSRVRCHAALEAIARCGVACEEYMVARYVLRADRRCTVPPPADIARDADSAAEAWQEICEDASATF